MSEVEVRVSAGHLYKRKHGKKRYLQITYTKGGRKRWITSSLPEKIEYLINKYAFTRTPLRSGFGYCATVPANLIPTLEYLSFRNTMPPENSELDIIAKTGATPIQEANIALGGEVRLTGSTTYYHVLIKGRAVTESLHRLPLVEVNLRQEQGPLVHRPMEIRYYENVSLLKQLLEYDENCRPIQMIDAITLVRSYNRRAWLTDMFIRNSLTEDLLAPVVLRTSVCSCNPDVWRRGLDWLLRHGYQHEVGELTIKKTLIDI
jgi:hypothetical protein